MSGVLGYALGYDAGRSDVEVSRQRREIVDGVFYGQRPVQVDQSYLDQLHQLVARFSQIDGYRCLSLMRASGVVKCQLALA